jgi:hypothetical protein
MSKPICMATWRYKKPDKRGYRGLKATLKYVTFREDAHHQLPADGRERWVDGGLGSSWREVYANSGRYAGPYVLAHHFVIAPDPDLMALVPEGQRRDLLHDLTVNTLIDWHQARDLAAPEMSFVIHDRETTDERAPGRQMLHSHVFCAGTIPTLEGRQSIMVKERDVVRNKGGLERDTNLNRIAEDNLASLLDRAIGLEWRLTREQDKDPQPTLDIATPIHSQSIPMAQVEPETYYESIDDYDLDLEGLMRRHWTGLDLDR